jgi:Ca-activated chloride channel family protein
MKPINEPFGNLLLVSKLVLVFLLMSSGLYGQDEETEDVTSSPYFVVACKDTLTDRLPLKGTSAEVSISGVIADVTINQRYCNTGENALEAIYVFPMSSQAAVFDMRMYVGDRLIIARIEEKEAARQQYDDAISQGQTASLLEQERPNVFRMSLGNILPGDTIDIKVKYVEVLIPVDGTYEFVYPTVVGPRYVSPTEDSASSSFAGLPYTPSGEPPSYTFGMDLQIEAGMDIKEMQCPSHDSIEIDFAGQSGSGRLISTHEGNRDFILAYKLAGRDMETGMLLFEGEDENFFLAMIQPPESPTDADIPPREYVLIMDVSGSMTGYPLDVSKELMENLISNIRITDRFNILFFAGGSAVLSENSLEATYENKQLALDMLSDVQAGGSTQMLNALSRALDMVGTEDFSRSFVIATDGYVTIEKEAFDLIRNNLGKANFFPFGIGKGVNRYIIEGMAHVGHTEPLIAIDQEDAAVKADQFREMIEYPVLTNIEVDYEGFEVYDVEPIYVPDVLAQRPILIYGKWTGNPAGQIHITGQTGTSNYSSTLNVTDFAPDEDNEILKYLWARKKIQMLDDYSKLSPQDSVLINEIIALSMKYNILSNYTSFIAIDSVIRNTGDSLTTVPIPLPLPEGVPDAAVGGYVSSDYENITEFEEDSHILRWHSDPVQGIAIISIELKPGLDLSGSMLVLHDLSGRELAHINPGILEAGLNQVELVVSEWLPGLTPGIYLLSLEQHSIIYDCIPILFAGDK